MFDKLKQLKQMRDQAQQVRQMLAQETIEAEAAHGKLKIIMDGNMETKSVEVNPELMQTDKKEELEKAIQEANNEAIKKTQRVMAQKMQQIGGLNIPGM